MDEIPDELYDNPYSTVRDFYDEMYPKIGDKFFRYASLQVLSPIIPKINYLGKEKRVSWSILLLTNSSGGKSAVLEEAKELSDQPYYISDITKARIQKDMNNAKGINMIINDAKEVFNSNLRKTLETIIGDGVISKKTDKGTAQSPVKVGGIMAGVPSDLTASISSGLLFRVVPIVVMYDKDEQKDVGEQIIENVDVEKGNSVKRKDISNYYDKLYRVQSKRDTENQKIDGWDLSRDESRRVLRMWKETLDELGVEETTNWFRELWDGLRFAACSAFLNYFNREKVREDGNVLLEVDDEDCERAVTLMSIEMALKMKYLMDTEEVHKKIEEIKRLKGYESKLG